MRRAIQACKSHGPCLFQPGAVEKSILGGTLKNAKVHSAYGKITKKTKSVKHVDKAVYQK